MLKDPARSCHPQNKNRSGCLCCCCSVTQLCPTLCNPTNCNTSGFLVLHYLPEFAQTLAHWLVIPSNHLILCHPLLLFPSIFPSVRVFSNGLALKSWPKYWSFNFSISPSNEYPGLISFRIDWFDLLAVQRTLKSLLWHHNTKASVLQHSAFSMVQLTSVHDYWINHSFDYMDLCQQSDVSAL